MTFQQWLSANEKYIEPADLHAWLEEAFNAGRKAERVASTDLPDCWVVIKDGQIVGTHDEPCTLNGIEAVRYVPAQAERVEPDALMFAEADAMLMHTDTPPAAPDAERVEPVCLDKVIEGLVDVVYKHWQSKTVFDMASIRADLRGVLRGELVEPDSLANHPNFKAAAVSEPDLSSLSDAAKERVSKWIAEGTFVERAIGTMLDQERELMKYEKATPPAAAVSEALSHDQIYDLFKQHLRVSDLDGYSIHGAWGFARAIEAAIRSK